MKHCIHSITPLIIVLLLASCASTNGLHFVKAKPQTHSELTSTGQHDIPADTIPVCTVPTIPGATATQIPAQITINNTARNKRVHIKQYVKALSNIAHIATAKIKPEDPHLLNNNPNAQYDVKYGLGFLIAGAFCALLFYFAFLGVIFGIIALTISDNALQTLYKEGAPDDLIRKAKIIHTLSLILTILSVLEIIGEIIAVLYLISLFL